MRRKHPEIISLTNSLKKSIDIHGTISAILPNITIETGTVERKKAFFRNTMAERNMSMVFFRFFQYSECICSNVIDTSWYCQHKKTILITNKCSRSCITLRVRRQQRFRTQRSTNNNVPCVRIDRDRFRNRYPSLLSDANGLVRGLVLALFALLALLTLFLADGGRRGGRLGGREELITPSNRFAVTRPIVIPVTKILKRETSLGVGFAVGGRTNAVHLGRKTLLGFFFVGRTTKGLCL